MVRDIQTNPDAAIAFLIARPVTTTPAMTAVWAPWSDRGCSRSMSGWGSRRGYPARAPDRRRAVSEGRPFLALRRRRNPTTFGGAENWR